MINGLYSLRHLDHEHGIQAHGHTGTVMTDTVLSFGERRWILSTCTELPILSHKISMLHKDTEQQTMTETYL